MNDSSSNNIRTLQFIQEMYNLADNLNTSKRKNQVKVLISKYNPFKKRNTLMFIWVNKNKIIDL